MPINPEVYAQRAFAKYKLEDYKASVSDFEKANKYSFSDSFDNDILAVKVNYLDKAQMLKEFDKAINLETDSVVRGYILSEKAEYLLKQKDYNASLNIYNSLLAAYRKGDKVSFSPEMAYYYRSLIKKQQVMFQEQSLITQLHQECVPNANILKCGFLRLENHKI